MVQRVTLFIDGVTSMSSHNDVHRMICHKLTADGEKVDCAELLFPAGVAEVVAEAFGKLSRAKSNVASLPAKPAAPKTRAASGRGGVQPR